MTPVLVCRILLPVFGLLGPLVVLLGLPGTWLVLVMAGLAEWWTEPELFSRTTLIGVIVVAVAGELWETLSSAALAKKAGAGRGGALAALVGGIFGAILGTVAIPIPLIGTLVGGGLGAFLSAVAFERRSGKTAGESLRIGRAAAAGQMIGLAGKLAASVLVYLWLVVAVFA